MNKPSKFNSRPLVRKTLQDIYKKHKAEDAKVGLKKNDLFQRFHVEMRLSPETRNIDTLKGIVDELKEIKQIKLFKKEFPSFASFMKYCKKEDVSIKDLSEI